MEQIEKSKITSQNPILEQSIHNHHIGVENLNCYFVVTIHGAGTHNIKCEDTIYSDGYIQFPTLTGTITSVRAYDNPPLKTEWQELELHTANMIIASAKNTANTVNLTAWINDKNAINQYHLKHPISFIKSIDNDEGQTFVNALIPNINHPDHTLKLEDLQNQDNVIVNNSKEFITGISKLSDAKATQGRDLNTQRLYLVPQQISFLSEWDMKMCNIIIVDMLKRGKSTQEIFNEFGWSYISKVSGSIRTEMSPSTTPLLKFHYIDGQLYIGWYGIESNKQIEFHAHAVIAKEITKTTTLTTTPEHKLLSEFLIAHKDGTDLTFGDVLSSDNINLPIDFQHDQDLVDDNGTHLVAEFKIDTKKLQSIRTFLKGKKDKIILPFTGNGVINIKVSIESDQLFPFAESPETRLDISSGANVQNIIIDMLNTEDVDFSHLVGDHMLVRVYAYKYKGSGSVEIIQNPTAGHHIKLSRINE